MANAIIDHLCAHRSVRKFKPQPVDHAHIREAVAAGQAASTSSAIQAYTVLHVTDQTKRDALVELTGGQPYVASAGAFLVICGDTRRHRLIAERDDIPYDTSLEAFLLSVIDASLLAQNMAVAFESMGYGICYIGGLRNRLPEASALLGAPRGIYPFFGLCVGVPDQSPDPRPRLPVDAVLATDNFHSDEQTRTMLEEYDHHYRTYLRARGAGDDKVAASWSRQVAQKFAAPMRTHLAEYYKSQGADLG